MKVIWTIAGRELWSFFRVPMGWVVVALYLLLTGYVFGLGVLVPGGPSSMRDFFLVSQVFVLILTPAVSMRPMAGVVPSSSRSPAGSMTSPGWRSIRTNGRGRADPADPTGGTARPRRTS